MASEKTSSEGWTYEEETAELYGDEDSIVLATEGEGEVFEDCIQGDDPRSKTDAVKAKRISRKKKRDAIAAGQLDLEKTGVALDVILLENATPMEVDGATPAALEATQTTSEPRAMVQVAQKVAGVNLPFARRSAKSTAAMIQAWMVNKFICPYEGCSFLPSGCRRTNVTIDGQFHTSLVIRPDRWCDQAEHWWCTHMEVPLALQCTKCTKSFASTPKFKEHLKGHKMSPEAVSSLLKQAKGDFCEAAGEEASTSDLSDLIKWPTRYYTAAEAKRKADDPRVILKSSEIGLQKEPRPATITKPEEKKAPTSVVAPVAVKRPMALDDRTDRLAIALKKRRMDDWHASLEPSAGSRLSTTARGQVRASIGFMRSRVVALLDSIDSNMKNLESDGEFRKRDVNLMSDRLRMAFNECRDQLDGGARGLGEWQRLMGSNPPSRKPSMLLVATPDWENFLGLKNQLLATRRKMDEQRLEMQANIDLMTNLKQQLSKVRSDLVVAQTTRPMSIVTTPIVSHSEETMALQEPGLEGTIQGMDPTVVGFNLGPVYLTDAELITMRGSILSQWDHYLKYYKRSLEVVEAIAALDLEKTQKIKND